jgi:von Willebrand factor type A domain
MSPLQAISITGVFALSLLNPIALAGQSGRLDFADRIRLVSCDPSTSKPCFRAAFNSVDAQGAPVDLNFAPGKDLHGQIKIILENQEIDPFFAISQTGNSKAPRGRLALILVDVSGSMNLRLPSGSTRFQTAQQALNQFLEGFDSSVDRVAIVPFESHNVARQIQAAQFATNKAGALQQTQALVKPQPKNNTALYSAVVLALQVLAREAGSGGSSPETLLIVMTDGKNEVYKGDDDGLLDGPSGLQQASAAVQASGSQVIGIGFGDPASIDAAALRQLSTKFYMADSLDRLKEAFTFARTLQTNRIVVTFAAPVDDRTSLEGKTYHVNAVLNLPDGKRLESGEKIWAAPEMSVPSYDGRCDTAELKAALQIPTSGNWLSLLRPVLVFLGLGTLLLVAWFWVPRLVWPEQYIGTFTTQGGGSMRWASNSEVWSKSRAARPSRPAPPGFETRKRGAAPPPRVPGERTVVQPDFSKSRLQRRPEDQG